MGGHSDRETMGYILLASHSDLQSYSCLAGCPRLLVVGVGAVRSWKGSKDAIQLEAISNCPVNIGVFANQVL